MGYSKYGLVLGCALIACIGASATTDTAPPTTAPTTEAPPPPPTTVPTTSTPAPTTPAPAPTTPAPAPTTPAPAPTTPTPAPTTPPAPSTTVAPSPDNRGDWTYSENNVTCIMAQMVVSTKVIFPLQEVNKTSQAEVTIPASAVATGSCDPKTQFLKLSWNKSNFVSFTFGRNDTTKMYHVSDISVFLILDSKTFPNISMKWLDKSLILESKADEFKTNFNQSYRCVREENLPLKMHNSSDIHGVLVLNKVQLQAFHTKEGHVFETAQDCELDTPDIVPIAVGCALAGLVLVVLIAYLVGRRRSVAQGYLSM